MGETQQFSTWYHGLRFGVAESQEQTAPVSTAHHSLMAHVVPHYLQYAGKKSFKYILPSGPQFFFFPMPHCLTFGSLTDQGLFNSGGAPT